MDWIHETIRRTRSILLRWTKDYDLADELTQVALIEVLRSRRKDTPPNGTMMKTAEEVIERFDTIDRFRKTVRKTALFRLFNYTRRLRAFGAIEGFPLEILTHGLTPEHYAMYFELHELAIIAFEALPDIAKTALTARLNRTPLRRLARRRGISISTASRAASSALDQIRKEVERKAGPFESWSLETLRMLL